MNEAAALLARCQKHGITLRPGEGGKLKVSPPPERLPEELREELKRHKQEILALLTTEAPAPLPEELKQHKAEALALLTQHPALPWPCPGCGGPVRLEPAAEEHAPTRFWTCPKCSTWGATREGAVSPVVWVSPGTVQ